MSSNKRYHKIVKWKCVSVKYRIFPKDGHPILFKGEISHAYVITPCKNSNYSIYRHNFLRNCQMHPLKDLCSYTNLYPNKQTSMDFSNMMQKLINHPFKNIWKIYIKTFSIASKTYNLYPWKGRIGCT